MTHQPTDSFAAVDDGARFRISDALEGFRVPRQRFRKGNTYALARPDGVVLVDAVHEITARAVTDFLGGRRVLAVLLTHADLLDQAFGPPQLLSHCFRGAPVVIHAADAKREGTTSPEAAAELLAGLGVEVYHVPGHTPGSVLYRVAPENLLFAGDAVVGRPYGSDPTERRPAHPPIAEADWADFVAGWAAVPPPVAAVLPLHGEMLFGPDSLVLAREAATEPGNVMRE